jgi:hypothetical protein
MHAQKRSSRWFVPLLTAVLSAAPTSTFAGFERVGPTVESNGYPLWYQDTTGLTLEFCSPLSLEELNGGWCLLLPADTTFPESFPDAFADEHFYWAADSVGDWTFNGQTSDARLILGLEAAFTIGPVRPGDQIVFGRLRIRIDDLPLSGTYTVYTPYGIYTFPNQVAGERIFYTEDIGINCAPGDFSCALQSSVGPFLLPSDVPGGAELPPVAGPIPGKLYIANPSRNGPVTGSVLPDYTVSGGETRNANIFRVEGPGGVLLFESTNFTLMGRLFNGDMPGRIHVDRSSYGRTDASRQIDVFVTAHPSREPRIPPAPAVDPVVPELSVYPAPCGGTATAPTAPVGVGSVEMVNTGSAYWVQLSPPEIPTAVCVAHTNARNTSGNIVPVYIPAPLGDKVFITEATYDPNAQSLYVEAYSMDAVAPPVLTLGGFGDVPNTPLDAAGQLFLQTPAPPEKVRILSSANGTNEMQVSVVASAGTANSAPQAVADSAETLANQAVTIAVLDNDSDPDGNALRVSSVTQPANGTAAISGGTAVTYTPTQGFVGADAFTYTVTDDRGGFATASVIVTVSLGLNEPPVAAPDAVTTEFQTTAVIAVLTNDSDPNGDALAITEVTQPATGGSVSHDGTRVTFVPAAGFSGDTTFTYTVSDGRGGSTLGLVTVTVRPAETLTISLAQFRQPNEWRVAGTSTVNGATITIHAGSTLDGPVIGTTTVINGIWTFRSSATGVPANNRISVESTGGAVRLNQVVTIR